MERIQQLLIGGTGLTTSTLLSNSEIPDLNSAPTIVSTIVQIVIGIVTLLGLFKKKK